jgi:signal transduction histidine kinase
MGLGTWELSDSTLLRVLNPAALRVAAVIRHDLADAEESQADLLDRLADLVRVIAGVDDVSRYHELVLTEAALTHWLLDELRDAVVREWALFSPAPAGEEMITMLQAFERVRGELATSADQRLARLLTSFRGLDLLVELAHDLRSPLTSIIFLSEALRQQQSGRINPLQSRQLGIIYSAALGLVSMATDVIELVRGDRLIADTPTSFSLEEILDSIRDLVDPMAEAKGIAMHMEVPVTAQREGHPVALSRVLLNLTTNALKFTERGSVALSVRERGPSKVEFSIRDTGPGLDFRAGDPLSAIRLNASGDRHGFSGSGLGLAICRRLLASMGSDLRYESRPGEGTTFFFELDLPPI